MKTSIRCTFCQSFMSANPTFDGVVQHSIPLGYFDENDKWIDKGERIEEEHQTLWTCKKCGRDNDPDELIPMPDDGYEQEG